MYRKTLALVAALFVTMLGMIDASEVVAQAPDKSNASASVPVSDICLMPMPGTEADAIGDVIGDMTEAPRGNGVIIDSGDGLLHLGLDGSIEFLQPRQKFKSGGSMGELVALPWSDEVAAIGVNESIIHDDLSVEEVQHHGLADLIGVFPSIQSVFLEISRVVGWNFMTGKTFTGVLETMNVAKGKYRLVTSNTYVQALPNIVDAPWFGAPISWEVSGPFSIDREGNLQKFEVEDIDPADAEIVKEHGPGGLNYFAHKFFSVPRFRTLYVLTTAWYQIGPDRRGFKIKGVTPSTEVLTSFDPGSRDALFGTTKGVLAVSPDGVARALLGPSAFSGAVRTFAQDPDDHYVLAGGDDGLFRIKKDALEEEAVPNGSANVIGRVTRILRIAFANVDLIFADRGTFSFENGEIKAVPSLATFARYARKPPISVLPRLQRVLVSKSDHDAPIINELRRSAEDGTCTLPLASTMP